MLSPYLPPDWDAIDHERDLQTLNLGIYPDEDEALATETFRAADHFVTGFALPLAGALLAYMLIGLAIAHHAGRI